MRTDRDLETILTGSGSGRVARASPQDAIGGVQPSHVVLPESAEQVAAVMRVAYEHGLTVLPRGRGSRMSWGAPPSTCDVLLDLSRLDKVRDHTASDMVVDVEAGVRLARLAEVLSQAGQRLNIDPPRYDTGDVDGGSVGGAIATAHAGPRRFRYGTVRDLLLGLTMVRADGEVVTSGSRVVKNVAGYDLGKLVAGSFGGLGIVVSATFRLHPVPDATAWVTARCGDVAEAYGKAWSIVDSPLEPGAVVIDQPEPGGPATLAVCLEGTSSGVPSRARRATELVDGDVVDEEPAWFARSPGGPGDTVLTVAALPSTVPSVCDMITAQAPGSRLRIDAASGVITVSTAASEDTIDAVDRLRAALPSPGSLTVRHASPPLPPVSVWGRLPAGVEELSRRVKEQFDPSGVLAPGRTPGVA